MKNITMIGHGGGAQLINRYAATGKDPQSPKIYIRYVVGDPSSSPYFTEHRPVTGRAGGGRVRSGEGPPDVPVGLPAPPACGRVPGCSFFTTTGLLSKAINLSH